MRYGRRKEDEHGTGGGMWLITFTDTMALMLTFFVMLFAMSHPEEETWEEFTTNIQSNFNRFYGEMLNRGAQDAININRIDYNQALDLGYLKALIVSQIEREEELGIVTMEEQNGALVLSLPNDLLFEPGQVAIKDTARKALYTLAGTLRRIQNRIEIVGHTDPTPISSASFPSNWDLSIARAASVAATLETVGYDRDITIRGQAAGHYQDIGDKIPEDERRQLARRVDIVIMQDDGTTVQLFDIGLP